MRMSTLLATVLTLTAGAAGVAQADTVTIANTTDVVAYSGGGPTDYYNGNSAVGGAIGSDFATSQLAVTTAAGTNGNYSVDLQYSTLFSGQEAVNSSTVYYPDIFLRSNPVGYSNAGFNYAISLGNEGANGGVAAGFYQNPSYLNSQQIWSGRSGVTYGGQYTNSTNFQPGQAGYQGYNAAAVVTGGTLLGGVHVTTGQKVGSNYIVDVQLTLTAAEAAVFANGFDVFWGTGDCANGSFLARVAGMGGGPSVVPEPATFAVLAMGLLGLTFIRRRNA